MNTVSILGVNKNSIYKSFKNVECYDIDRDLRSFKADTPIVAHPPCRSWSRFCSHQAKPYPGEKELAPLCVQFLIQCGGVLEHPAHSNLWTYMNLPKPGQPISKDGLWSVEVRQSWWGDIREKNTWLLFSKVDSINLNILPTIENANSRLLWNKMSKQARSATIPAFARWLINVARSVPYLQ